jgi:cytochrome c biogenesis protein CcdA
MKLAKLSFLLLLLLAFLFNLFTLPTLAQETQKIFYFYGNGCPHCARVEQYFEQNDIYSRYSIEKKEIYSNPDNAVLFNSMLNNLGVPQSSRGVPTIIIGNEVITGDTPIINWFEEGTIKVVNKNTQGLTNLTLLVVIGASLVDAINPCAFAVLIILMTTILATGENKKALKAGVAFSASIFISYFLMGLGIYQALGFGPASTIFFSIIGWLAIILGLFNLKDFFWYGKGFLMEVPLSWRPTLKGLIKSVTNPIGAFAIGFLVSLFLLPCTSGPYIVILGMLAKRESLKEAILYLLLYNLIFIFPMILITLAVYKGFDPGKAEEIRQRRLRLLHLVAGIVMLIMGIVILKAWI